MEFVVHNTGDWVKADANTSAVRLAPEVLTYNDLEQVPQADKAIFEWMLNIGEVCMSSGCMVWQIRNWQK